MAGLKPHTPDGWEALKLLILRFQKLHKAGHKEIGEAIGRSRATVSSDLNKPASSHAAEAKLYNLYGNWVLEEARKKPGYPTYLRSLFEEVLTDEALQEVMPKPTAGPAVRVESHRGPQVVSDKVSLLRHSGYPVDNHAMRRLPDGLPRLYGLSVLVRPSNETVEVEKPDGKISLEYGLSISLLNVLPEYVQTGAHHPLFKLRQRGTGRNDTDIEGIILCQDDRIVLSGRDDGQGRNMLASIYFRRETAANFRTPDNGRPTESLHGLMLGVSNSKNHFCSLFTLFALPGGLISEEQLVNEPAMKKFQQVYDKGRQVAGVYPEGKIAEILKGLSIKDSADDVGKMLKKSNQRRIFSVAI